MMRSIKSKWFLLIALLVALFGTLLSAPFIGTIDTGFRDLFTDSVKTDVILDLRLSRIVFAFLVGFSLAMVGAVFQALLKNDLATPYTLGVSSGGALGAVLAIKLGLDIVFAGFTISQVFSVLLSIITIILIYLLAIRKSFNSQYSVILAGVTLNFFFAALIMFIHYLSDFTETYRMVRWLMGGLQVTGWVYILSLLPVVLITFFYFYRNSEAFNIITSGDEMAVSKGVDVISLHKYSFLSGSVLIGFCVALAGPIGFIGLIFPHLVRLAVGPDHKWLLLLAPLSGGIFLAWSDVLARTVISPAELPVGIITSIVGGPFFLWLLVRRKQQ